MLEVVYVPRRRLAEEGDLARQVLHVAHPIHVALVDPLVQLGGLRVQGLSGEGKNKVARSNFAALPSHSPFSSKGQTLTI